MNRNRPSSALADASVQRTKLAFGVGEQAASWAASATPPRVREQVTAGSSRLTQSIDVIERVQLGGVEQTISIRGNDDRCPLMLFLHGGPGMPHMPFAHLYAALEESFMVVQWDQRGAGKSFSSELPASECHLERYVADAHELIEILLARFSRRKLVIVGHSWGSIIGAFVAARFPDLVAAYVGVGQVAHLPSAERQRYEFAVGEVRRSLDRDGLRTLTRVGPPPYPSLSDSEELEALVNRLNAASYRPPGRSFFLRLALSSPAYSWLDVMRIPLGVRLCTRLLWTQIFHQIDLFSQLPRINVPVCFLTGRHDTVVGYSVTKRYFDTLDAPRGKRFITFEASGHWPHLEEPERFRAILRSEVLHSACEEREAEQRAALVPAVERVRRHNP